MSCIIISTKFMGRGTVSTKEHIVRFGECKVVIGVFVILFQFDQLICNKSIAN